MRLQELCEELGKLYVGPEMEERLTSKGLKVWNPEKNDEDAFELLAYRMKVPTKDLRLFTMRLTDKYFETPSEKARKAFDRVKFSKEQIDKITAEANNLPDITILAGSR